MGNVLVVLLLVILLSGCTDLKTPRYETTITISEDLIKGGELIGQPQTLESACKNVCAYTCAELNMVYSYSELGETIMESSTECFCECD